jgi:putative membrane protein
MIALVVAAVILLPLLVLLVMLPTMGLWGGHMMDGTATGPWLIGWGLGILILVGLGVLLYRALRGQSAQESDPAIEELRTAYARGDLSDEEFERRRDRLQRDR